MAPTEIKRILENQLQLLKNHSEQKYSDNCEHSRELCNLTEQMVSISAFIIDTWGNDKKMFPDK